MYNWQVSRPLNIVFYNQLQQHEDNGDHTDNDTINEFDKSQFHVEGAKQARIGFIRIIHSKIDI